MNLTKKIISLFALVALFGSTVSANNFVDLSEEYSSELIDYIMEFEADDFKSVVEDNSIKYLDGTFKFEEATKDIKNRYNFFALREYYKYNTRLSGNDKVQLKALIKYFNENYKTYKEKRDYFVSLNNRIEAFEKAMNKKLESVSCTGLCKSETRYIKAKYGNLLKALKYHNAIVLLRQSVNEKLVNELPEVPMTEEEKVEAEKLVRTYVEVENKLIKEILVSANSFIERLPEIKETGNLEAALDANFGKTVSALLKLNNYTASQKGLNSSANGDLSVNLKNDNETIDLKGKLSFIGHNLVNYFNISDLEYTTTDKKVEMALEKAKEMFGEGVYLTDNPLYKQFAKFDINSVNNLLDRGEIKVLGKRNGHFLVSMGNQEYLLSTNGNEHELELVHPIMDLVIKFDDDKIISFDGKLGDGNVTFNQSKGVVLKVEIEDGVELNTSLSKNRNGEYGNFSFRFYVSPDSTSERPLYITATVNDYNLKVNAQIPKYGTEVTRDENGFKFTKTLDFLAKLKLTGSLSNIYELNSLSGNLEVKGKEDENLFKADIDYSKKVLLRANMNGTISDKATINGKIDINYVQRNLDNGVVNIKVLNPKVVSDSFIMDVKMFGGNITGETYLRTEGKELFKIDTKGTYSYNKMDVENDYTINLPMFAGMMTYTGNLDFSYNNATLDKVYNFLFDLTHKEVKMIDFKLKGDYRRQDTNVEAVLPPTNVKTTQELQMSK